MLIPLIGLSLLTCCQSVNERIDVEKFVRTNQNSHLCTVIDGTAAKVIEFVNEGSQSQVVAHSQGNHRLEFKFRARYLEPVPFCSEGGDASSVLIPSQLVKSIGSLGVEFEGASILQLQNNGAVTERIINDVGLPLAAIESKGNTSVLFSRIDFNDSKNPQVLNATIAYQIMIYDREMDSIVDTPIQLPNSSEWMFLGLWNRLGVLEVRKQPCFLFHYTKNDEESALVTAEILDSKVHVSSYSTPAMSELIGLFNYNILVFKSEIDGDYALYDLEKVNSLDELMKISPTLLPLGNDVLIDITKSERGDWVFAAKDLESGSVTVERLRGDKRVVLVSSKEFGWFSRVVSVGAIVYVW